MIGVVLSGGQSLRMGADKGLLQYSDCAVWAQRAYDLLAALGISVVVSVNNHQTKRYTSFFEVQQQVHDNVQLHIGGPLKGILSVHLQYPGEDLLVLACDMINMQQEPLLHLIQLANPGADAFVFRNKNHAEPLCGLYTARALQRLHQLYTNHQLHKHSLHYALQQLNVLYTDVVPEWQKCFNNYNSREDLAME